MATQPGITPPAGNPLAPSPPTPPNKFLISTSTCQVATLRQMCAALWVTNKGTFLVMKSRITGTIKEKNLSEADLFLMPQFKPAFLRKLVDKSRKKLGRIKTGAAAATRSEDTTMQGSLPQPSTPPPVAHIPGPLEHIPLPLQRPLSPNYPAALLPEAATIQSLVAVFNES